MYVILPHIALLLVSIAIMWIVSGVLIGATERVAKRYNKPGFAVAFLVLGFMTSISEMAVALNATLQGVPEVSAGNLVGASIVIFLCIVPLLALCGGKVEMKHALRGDDFAITLFLVLLPSLLVMDGRIDWWEGSLLVGFFVWLIYRLHTKQPIEKVMEETAEKIEWALIHKHRATILDMLCILGGAIATLVAGRMLVTESVFLTGILGVPSSIAGLLILSIGTNIPECTIAIRAVLNGKTDIAFGDYLGSAATNSLLFGLLALANGGFLVESTEFIVSAVIGLVGYVLLFIFCWSKNHLSRTEAAFLFFIYTCFFGFQLWTVVAGGI